MLAIGPAGRGIGLVPATGLHRVAKARLESAARAEPVAKARLALLAKAAVPLHPVQAVKAGLVRGLPEEVATTRWAMSVPAVQRKRSLNVDVPAPVTCVRLAARAAAVAGPVVAAVAADVEAAVVVVDPMSRSSTTLPCSAGSTMASGSIGSATSAV